MQFRIVDYKNIAQDRYYIYEDGSVWSTHRNKFLSKHKDRDGYLYSSLYTSGKQKKKVYIAKLVVYHFIGNPPADMKDPTIDHIDENKENNRLDNLRWMERSENAHRRTNRGWNNYNHSVLTPDQVIEIADLLIYDTLTPAQIAVNYGVARSTIYDIKNYISWKRLTKQYDFKNKVKL